MIGNKKIGRNHPCFIIAEAGVNHNGDIKTALKLIDIAVNAKSDAVKFQTFNTEKLLLPDLDKAEYQKIGDGKKGNYSDMIKRLELSESEHKVLYDYCNEKGILFLSTPFDNDSTDLLNELGVKAFKIDSGNLNNHQHIDYIAKKGKPIILSTGMSNVGEIDEAVSIVKGNNVPIIILHCTSNYPPSYQDINLRAMETMRLQFNSLIGYSDHTPGIAVSIAAVALGAVLIEKHFTIDRNQQGPDHLASLLSNELIELVDSVSNVQSSLGYTEKKPVLAEKDLITSLRRSIVSIKDIKKGTIIKQEYLDIKRPGNGIPPKYFDLIKGRVARENIPCNSLITWDKV